MVAAVTEVERTVNKWIGAVDYPMAIVTAAGGGERDGCLVGFWAQASISPLRFLVCLSDKNRTYRISRSAGVLGFHLAPDRDDLVELFGSQTGDEIDKLARVDWREGPEGVPLLDACENWFAGRVLERHVVGDHVAHLLEPIAAGAGTVSTYGFQRAKRFEPGHEA